MNKMIFEFPTPFESERLSLRSYCPGDGKWYYAMSLKNREHLSQYEAENVAANIASEEAAEVLVQELADAWKAHNCFFIGTFEKKDGGIRRPNLRWIRGLESAGISNWLLCRYRA